jgi:hypothetical protein
MAGNRRTPGNQGGIKKKPALAQQAREPEHHIKQAIAWIAEHFWSWPVLGVIVGGLWGAALTAFAMSKFEIAELLFVASNVLPLIGLFRSQELRATPPTVRISVRGIAMVALIGLTVTEVWWVESERPKYLQPKAVVQLESVKPWPRKQCSQGGFLPKSDPRRVQEEEIERLAPQLGEWGCFNLTFRNIGSTPATGIMCQTLLDHDFAPKYPPTQDGFTDLTSLRLYSLKYDAPKTDSELRPQEIFSCLTESLPSAEFQQVLHGDVGLSVEAVVKYRDNSLPRGMIGVTKVGRYFINDFDKWLLVGQNTVTSEGEHSYDCGSPFGCGQAARYRVASWPLISTICRMLHAC